MWVCVAIVTHVRVVPFVGPAVSECILNSQKVLDAHPLSEIRAFCDKDPLFVCVPERRFFWQAERCRPPRRLNDVDIYKQFMGLIPSPPPPPGLPPDQPAVFSKTQPTATTDQSSASGGVVVVAMICGVLSGVAMCICVLLSYFVRVRRPKSNSSPG